MITTAINPHTTTQHKNIMRYNHINNQTHQLIINPSEFHFIISAMNAYALSGYGYIHHKNESHANNAELLHDELVDAYGISGEELAKTNQETVVVDGEKRLVSQGVVMPTDEEMNEEEIEPTPLTNLHVLVDPTVVANMIRKYINTWECDHPHHGIALENMVRTDVYGVFNVHDVNCAIGESDMGVKFDEFCNQLWDGQNIDTSDLEELHTQVNGAAGYYLANEIALCLVLARISSNPMVAKIVDDGSLKKTKFSIKLD
jgi:hypothetical protein